LSIVEQVERCVIAQPGVTSGAIRVSLRHSVKNVEAILQALRRCVKVGSVTRTGEKWKYQYWPAAKKEAA